MTKKIHPLRIFLITSLFLLHVQTFAQVKITGRIVSKRNEPVAGASVFINNSLDGCTSDSLGFFLLNTTEKDSVMLIATEVGFDNTYLQMKVSHDTCGILLAMKSNFAVLNNVLITAGSYSASNNNKTILQPMDIMTTAGANADIAKAIETLPGTQQTGISSGLFVRGGDAAEAAVIIDGMVVQNAFQSNVPGVSQPSRFGPFEFKGISFSSGGFSVRYSQALSSVLELNTKDIPDKSNISIGANITGVFASGIYRKKNYSFELGLNYNSASLFYNLAKTNVLFYNPPFDDGVVLKYTFEPNQNEIVKAVARYSNYTAGVKTPDPFTAGDTTNFSIKNLVFYSNISYQKRVKDRWVFFTGASYSLNRDNINWVDKSLESIPNKNKDERTQFRIEVKNNIAQNLSILTGLEIQNFKYGEILDTVNNRFSENIPAAYVEANWAPLKFLALRPGIRYEGSRLIKEQLISPRISLAIKTSKNIQVSIASGFFYQDPENIYLLEGYKPRMAEAIHYLINYQWQHDGRTFRIEGYYKDYEKLVKEYAQVYDPNSYRVIPRGTKINNSGFGYAKGAELFFHDKKSIHDFDYWVSYSYIDTKRFYKNFPTEATPDFVSAHNLSIVTKYFVNTWQTNFSITYSYASGKPFYNPSGNAFLSDRTPPYQNLALGIGRLQSVKKWFTVIYVGIDNITNHHNILGYRYSADGTRKYPMLPALYRSIIIGTSFSLSQFSKTEL